MRRLLLISSSRTHNTGFLDHCAAAIVARLGNVKSLLFVPYALFDWDGYTKLVRDRLEQEGITVTSVHESSSPLAAVNNAESIFIGGGNSFRLVNRLYEQGLMIPIQEKATAGMPYMGTSAGSNVACPTMMTSNDMPIVQPPSFDTLNLISFQINPHYIDPDPASTHQGETRELRIEEYHEENSLPVLGLREGSWLRVDDDTFVVVGENGACLFLAGQPPVETPANSYLNPDGTPQSPDTPPS